MIARPYEDVWRGLILGALAVRSPYDKHVSLRMLHENLDHVVEPRVSRHDIATMAERLKAMGLVSISGSVHILEYCRLGLRSGVQSTLPLEDIATAFVIGGLAVHYAPLVGFKMLRGAALSLWSSREVAAVLPAVVTRLRAERIIFSEDLSGDPVHWYVSLWRDQNLLAV